MFNDNPLFPIFKYDIPLKPGIVEAISLNTSSDVLYLYFVPIRFAILEMILQAGLASRFVDFAQRSNCVPNLSSLLIAKPSNARSDSNVATEGLIL